jgi:thioredoxin-related protein
MRFSAYSLALALTMAPFCGPSFAGAPGEAAASSAVKWVSLEEAAKKASTSGRYLFVSFYTDWCGYCRKLNATTLRARPVVSELGKNFESVRLNAESEDVVVWKGKKLSSRALANKWGVESFPTLLFLNKKGEIVGSFASYVEPDVMIKLLTYISSGARERKVTFNDYLEGKS